MPIASLPDLEQRLEACLLELDKLHRTRPGLPTAMARAEAGERIDDLLDEIAELQRMIDTSPAETLEDAAVKLRRLTVPTSRKDSPRGFWPGLWGPWRGRRQRRSRDHAQRAPKSGSNCAGAQQVTRALGQ